MRDNRWCGMYWRGYLRYLLIDKDQQGMYGVGGGWLLWSVIASEMSSFKSSPSTHFSLRDAPGIMSASLLARLFAILASLCVVISFPWPFGTLTSYFFQGDPILLLIRSFYFSVFCKNILVLTKLLNILAHLFV